MVEKTLEVKAIRQALKRLGFSWKKAKVRFNRTTAREILVEQLQALKCSAWGQQQQHRCWSI
jgi:transposase